MKEDPVIDIDLTVFQHWLFACHFCLFNRAGLAPGAGLFGLVIGNDRNMFKYGTTH